MHQNRYYYQLFGYFWLYSTFMWLVYNETLNVILAFTNQMVHENIKPKKLGAFQENSIQKLIFKKYLPVTLFYRILIGGKSGKSTQSFTNGNDLRYEKVSVLHSKPSIPSLLLFHQAQSLYCDWTVTM